MRGRFPRPAIWAFSRHSGLLPQYNRTIRSGMTIKVTVFHVASKEIEVEVPDSLLEKDAIRDFVQDSLNEELPEVHEGSSFEFPTGFQLDGDDFETDLKG
jgi:hypothetical protein